MQDKNVITRIQLHELLDQIVLWDALELCQTTDEQSGENTILIPYLMNDAVEYYIELTGANMDGTFSEKSKDLEIIRIEDHVPMGFRVHSLQDGEDSTKDVTVWYKAAFLHIHCYQYHLIGHDWRKEKGQEFHRRLVNLACVIHDKRTYLGDTYCNELEDLLADLIEFPPFLYYSPINESILDWYPDSPNGIDAAIFFAGEDEKLLEKIYSYEEKYYSGTLDEEDVRSFAETLLEECYRHFWKNIQQAIEEASLSYEERSYSEELTHHLLNRRKEIEENYKKKGYDGSYPYMTYCDSAFSNPLDEIYFVEQHPFTVLEWENYSYKFFEIHIKNGNLSDCEWIRN